MKKSLITTLIILLFGLNTVYADQGGESMTGAESIADGLGAMLLAGLAPVGGGSAYRSNGGKFTFGEHLAGISGGAVIGSATAPTIFAAGAGLTIVGLSKMPIDMIRSLSELNKIDTQSLKETTNTEKQLAASLSLNDNGQVKRITIPLEVNPHPIQLNQKLDSAPSEDIESP